MPRLICIPKDKVEFEQTTEFKTKIKIRQFRTLKYSDFPKPEKAEKRKDYPSYTTSWGVNADLSKLDDGKIDIDDPKVVADYIVGTRGSINGLYLEKLQKYIGLKEARDGKFISEEEYFQLTSRAIASGIFAQFNDDFTSATLIPPKDFPDFVDDSRFETYINSTIGFPPNKKSLNSMLALSKLTSAQTLKIFEAQWLTGGIIDPKTGVKLCLKNAIDDQIISEIYADELKHNLFGPFLSVQSSRDFSQSYYDLMNDDESFCSWRSVKIENFNVELRFPFLRSQKVGPSMELDEVFLETLWRKKCALRNLLPFFELSKLQPFLDGYEPLSKLQELTKQFTHGNPLPIVGYWKQDTGERVSIKQAAKEKIVTPGLARALLEAQAANGAFLDPHDPKNLMDVDQAVEKGFLSEVNKAALSRAMIIAHGDDQTLIDHIKSSKKTQNPHLERLVRLQMACGGLIHPELNFRVPLNHLSDYFDEKVINYVKYCLEDRDSYGYTDVNTKENMPYSALLRRGILKDGANVLVYDPEVANAEPEMMSKEEIMTLLTSDINKKFSLSDLADANLLPQKTVDEIENGKIPKYSFEQSVLNPIKIGLRKYGRPLVGVKLDQERLRWPEALKQGEVSNLVLKDMVNSQIACAPGFVEVDKFPANMQNGFNRTLRIINGAEYDEDDNQISLLQALEKKLMREADALKLIDAQLATGGIIDHRVPFRLNFDSVKAKKLLENPEVWDKKIKKAIKNGLFKDLTMEGQRKCSYSLLLENASSDEEGDLFLRLPSKNSQAQPIRPSSANSSLRSSLATPTPDSPLRVADLSKSTGKSAIDGMTPGKPRRQRKTQEAAAPILTSSLENSFGDNDDNSSRPIAGHRLFVEDSDGNQVRLSDAVKDGIITEEEANELIKNSSSKD